MRKEKTWIFLAMVLATVAASLYGTQIVEKEKQLWLSQNQAETIASQKAMYLEAQWNKVIGDINHEVTTLLLPYYPGKPSRFNQSHSLDKYPDREQLLKENKLSAAAEQFNFFRFTLFSKIHHLKKVELFTGLEDDIVLDTVYKKDNHLLIDVLLPLTQELQKSYQVVATVSLDFMNDLIEPNNHAFQLIDDSGEIILSSNAHLFSNLNPMFISVTDDQGFPKVYQRDSVREVLQGVVINDRMWFLRYGI